MHGEVLEITLGVSVRLVLFDRLGRAGLVDVVPGLLFEEDAGRRVGLRLIVAREVQIDIRRLFGMEPDEGLERDVVPVLDHLRPADRAVLVRQIEAGLVFLGHVPLDVAAVRAAVVRRQRVDFRDSGHRRDQRRSDRASRADDVPVVVAETHEFGGNPVNDVESAAVDTGHLRVEALLDDLGERIPVPVLGRAVDQVVQHLVAVVDDREGQVIMDWGDFRTEQGSDLVCVFDDDFFLELLIL